MVKTSRTTAVLCVACVLVAFGPSAAWMRADSPKAPAALEEWLPQEVLGIAKVSGLGADLRQFLGSALRRDIEALAPVKQLLREERLRRALKELALFEEETGKNPLDVVDTLFGREVVVGVRLNFLPEVIVLTRTAGEDELAAARKTIESVIEKRAGTALPDPAREEHEGVTIETFDKLSMARLGSVMAFSSSAPFLKRAIDIAQGKSKGSLKESRFFKRLGDELKRKRLVTIAVNPQLIPNFHLPEKMDNGLGSLLAGGWLAALRKSDLVTASLGFGDSGLGLEFATYPGGKGLEEGDRIHFPDASAAALSDRLRSRGALAVIDLHRDIHGWWERREDLLEPKATGQLLEFSQVMSIVFQGKNFQDEVLPELGPTVTLVARNQEYPDLKVKPQPALPGFAVVFTLKDPARFENNLVAGFQTLVGIINADRAQKKEEGGMAMILRTEKVGSADLHTVAMNLPPEKKPGMPYNFTPSLAVAGGNVVISSSRELAQVVVEELSKGAASATAASAVQPDAVTIDAGPAHEILRQNRDLLVADQMLKKGKDKEAAAAEIDMLLGIVQQLRDLTIESKMDPDALRVRVNLRVRSGEKTVEKTAKKGAEKGTEKGIEKGTAKRGDAAKAGGTRSKAKL